MDFLAKFPFTTPFRWLTAVGDACTFWMKATAAAVRIPYPRDVLILTAKLVLSTMPVVVAISFFAGAMLTVQAFSSLSLIGGGPFSGTLVALGGVREVFPMLAGAGVAARTGAEFAATIGTMRVSQQTDALRVMGIDPIALLAAPRIIACTIGTPLCVTVANAVGLLGAFVVGVFQLGVDAGSMQYHLALSINAGDFKTGVYKGLALGFIIASIATREGFEATGGAEGVGRSTNRAVVRAMMAVCFFSLWMTFIVYGTRVIL